jgi:hypothetical protein
MKERGVLGTLALLVGSEAFEWSILAIKQATVPKDADLHI